MKAQFAKNLLLINRGSLALGCVALVLTSIITGVAASRSTVTATIYNSDSSGNAFTLQSDGSTSGVYSTGSGIDSALTPDTAAAGTLYDQWNLDLTHSSRSYSLTLTPVNGSPAVFSGSLPFNGQLYSRCFTSSGTYQNWMQIQPNFPDSTCALRANFTYNRTGYSLVMSPAQTGTGTATVSCTTWSSKSNMCVAWTDVPTIGIANANVANLYSGLILIGQYYLSFNIGATHP